MKTHKMKRIKLLTIALLLQGEVFAKTDKMKLTEALHSESVTMEAINFQGKYVGKTTKLKIANKERYALTVQVDIGLILKPGDTLDQPMILAGGEYITVQGGAFREVEVMTFCGNYSKHCPAIEGKYAYDRMADDTLVKLLTYIKANGLHDYLGQSAVWCVTNKEPLTDVYDPQRKELAERLLGYLATLTGQKIPDIRRIVAHQETSGAPPSDGKALSIIANFEVRLDAPKTMTLGVYNDKNEMIQKVFENQEFASAGHIFEVDFQAENVSPGFYYIRLKENEIVLQERKVKVD